MGRTDPHMQEPKTDTIHPAELRFDERPAAGAPAASGEGKQPKTENFTTDVMMLQKADVWMSQFKTRLNVGIVAMVVLWGGLSYFKTHDMHLEARSMPEQHILADSSHDENKVPVHAVEGDSLQRREPIEAETSVASPEPAASMAPAAEQAQASAPVPVPAKASKPLKKTVAKMQKAKTAGGKAQARKTKKFKKSLAAKPAS